MATAFTFLKISAKILKTKRDERIFPSSRIFLICRFAKTVLRGVILEILIVKLVAAAKPFRIAVHTETVVCDLDHAARNVGAVVGNAFQIGQQIGKDKSKLDRAFADAESFDLVGAESDLKIVDDLLQRFHADGNLNIVMNERHQGVIHDLVYGSHHDGKLPLRRRRKFKLFRIHLLRGFRDVHGVVGEALQISYHMEKLRDLKAILLGKVTVRDLHQIRADLVLVDIDGVLLLLDLVEQLFIVAFEQREGFLHGVESDVRHIARNLTATLDRDAGGRKQTVVEQSDLVGRAALFLDEEASELFELLAERKQTARAEKVKAGMDEGDSLMIDLHLHKGKADDRVQRIEKDHRANRADDVKAKVNHRNALCVLIRADGGNKRRHAGTDILTENDRECRAEGNLSRRGKRLQNTDGSRGALNDRRQKRARKNAENGVAEKKQKLLEFGNFRERLHGGSHVIHTEDQHGKAEKDQTDVLLLGILQEKIEDDTDQRKDRRERRRLQHGDEKAVAAETRKAEDPRRNGRTDVRTHNDRDNVRKRHNARVYEADHHDRGRRRALNDRRHGGAERKSLEGIGGQLTKQRGETGACTLFQGISHNAHTEQKQRNTAN